MPADVNPELLRLLRCPACKSRLSRREDELRCSTCGKTYPIVLGIPDLRVYEDPLIPLQDDYRKGEKVQVEAERLNFAELVRYYWSLPTYPYTPPDLKERFIRQVLSQEDRVRETFSSSIGRGQTFLEAGCGTASLLRVVSSRFGLAVGCDVAFRWLLIARKGLQEAGLPVNLVCCCADYLPFPDEAFSSVAAVSLLEHVPDAGAVISEFDRVMRKEGSIFVYTSNRFSLGPEPHVRVWGVGFLPRRWMSTYVKWVRKIPYEKKRLLSRFEVRRLFRKVGLDSLEFSLPAITAADRKKLRGLEKYGARLFTWLGHVPFVRPFLLVVSPVIQVVARRTRTNPAQIADALASAMSRRA